MDQVTGKAVVDRVSGIELETGRGLHRLAISAHPADSQFGVWASAGPRHSLGKLKDLRRQCGAGDKHIVTE